VFPLEWQNNNLVKEFSHYCLKKNKDLRNFFNVVIHDGSTEVSMPKELPQQG